MTKRVVVVDHHDSYTYNLVHLVAAVTGILPEVVEHDEVEADALLGSGFSHIVLSPGPGSPDEERDFSVGRAVLLEARVPVLGVCLGMQGLVSVYGGRVAQIEPAHGEVAVVTHDGSGIFEGCRTRSMRSATTRSRQSPCPAYSSPTRGATPTREGS